MYRKKKLNSIIYPSKIEMGVTPQVFPVIDHHHARATAITAHKEIAENIIIYCFKCAYI